MYRKLERPFILISTFFTVISLALLFLVIYFITKESLVVFQEISLFSFLSGSTWRPLASEPQLGIFPMIAATFYVSVIAVLISLPIGIGCAVELAVLENERIKGICNSVLAVLAGIPSVIYGFIGLLVVVKFLEKKAMLSSGESMLSGGIVLAVMVLPYIVSSALESMEHIYKKYKEASLALGISKSYMIRSLILPASKGAIITSIILAFSRAMGETMAVMMVIGNSPIMPTLLGKGQTIPALIALEMGTAGLGSLHYHGLFSAGFVLMVVLILMNALFYVIRKKFVTNF